MTYKLFVGDCLEVLQEIEDGSIDLIITSPPYNCRKDYGVIDDMWPWEEYYRWIKKVLKELYRVLVVGGVIAINVPGVVRFQREHQYADTWGDYEAEYETHRVGKKIMGTGRIEAIGFEIFQMMKKIDNHMREPIIWVKGDKEQIISTTYQMGSDNNPYLRATHEMILLGSKGQWYHRGGTGRRGKEAMPFLDETKDTWYIKPESSRVHPAVFPIEIPRRLIKLFTHASDAVVLDPFMGIGTTGIAAMELGRAFIGIDLNEQFVQQAEDRLYQEIAQMKLWEE